MLKYLFTLCLLCASASALSQEKQQANAGSEIEIDVLAVYEEVVSEGYPSVQVYRTLANGRFLENNFIEAKKWYTLLFSLDKDLEAEDYYNFSKTLQALNQDAQAKKYLARYNALAKLDD